MKVTHIGYSVVAVLALGALYAAWTGVPKTNQATMDERQREALILVQSSPAIGAATILDAMSDHVRSMKDRGQGVRLGDWRVAHVEGDIYEIRVQLRDQSVRGQWFEREYIWHAHLGHKKVNAASLPADGVTPKPPDSDQPATPPVPGLS